MNCNTTTLITHNLPLGFRFCPTEEQLLNLFLKRKAMGLQLPHHGLGVIETNLYTDQATPWIILNDSIQEWQLVVDCLGKVHPTKKVVYVITKLSKVAENGKRKARRAGCGTWHGNTALKDIRNSRGDLIGKKRTLTFESDEETVGQWNMDEYQLAGVSLEGIVSNDHVICRIKRDESKTSKGGRLVVTPDNAVSSASTSTLSDDYEKFEGLGKRKEQHEDEEINQQGYKMGRTSNNDRSNVVEISNSTAKIASAAELKDDDDEEFFHWLENTIDFNIIDV